VNGRKISGNAEHICKTRVLHHGTLLFSSNIEALTSTLKIDPFKYDDKAVKSVRSQVTNISDYLKTGLNIIEFRDKILDYILSNFPGASLYELTEQDKERIRELVEKKYSDWNWNFGFLSK
ncbi:unnamed protein product, partial [marine sediment metagenome]